MINTLPVVNSTETIIKEEEEEDFMGRKFRNAYGQNRNYNLFKKIQYDITSKFQLLYDIHCHFLFHSALFD